MNYFSDPTRAFLYNFSFSTYNLSFTITIIIYRNIYRTQSFLVQQLGTLMLLRFLNNQLSPEIELKFEVMNLAPSLAFRWLLCHLLSPLGSVVWTPFPCFPFGFYWCCLLLHGIGEFQNAMRSSSDLLQLLYFIEEEMGFQQPFGDSLMITRYLATMSDWSLLQRDGVGRKSPGGHFYFTQPSTQILPPTGVSAEPEVTVPGCSRSTK